MAVADGGSTDARVDAAGDKMVLDDKVSECVALPAQPQNDTSSVFIDCTGMLGMLQLHTGKFTPLTEYQGSLGYVTIAGDYAVYVADSALFSVSLIDGVQHELARTLSPEVLAVTRDGRYAVLRSMRNSNALLVAAVDGSAPAQEITSADTEKHRLQGAQDRLLFTHDGAIASVDLKTAEVTDLGPAQESIFNSDGSWMAFLEEESAKLVAISGDGSERREWDVPAPPPTSLVAFTRDDKQLIVRHDGGMRRLALDSGDWSDLAAPPAGAVMQLDVADHALIYQHALGEIDEQSGMFRDGFGLSALPLDGAPAVMLGQVDSSYFRDYFWHSPSAFSADLAELIYPTRHRGLDIIDLTALTVRGLAAVGCSEGAAGFSPDEQTTYYWVCDDAGRVKKLDALDRSGNILVDIPAETEPPLRFAPDSRHFTVQGHAGFWLAALSGESQFFEMDEQTVNTQNRETPPYFPYWRVPRTSSLIGRAYTC